MAARKSAKKSSKKTATKSAPADRAIDALLAEAAALGWGEATMAGVAARAGLPLGELLTMFPTKAAILTAYMGRVDGAALGPVKAVNAADSARDRLFDLVMRRLDVLQADRGGVTAVMRGLCRDPFTAFCVLMRADRSAAATLAAAGIPADGPCGLLRRKGLKLVMGATFRAWIRDDTADMAKTMAALDKALSWAARAAGFLDMRFARMNPAAAE